jgi:hypothetical protein
MGYAMILAALYDDKATFDRLSATVQAGIAFGRSKGDVTGLFPWYWTQDHISTQYSYKDINSASDADINIALAYAYANMAVTVYGWTNGPTTYETMASNYIAAVRMHDFSKTDTNASNNYVLADGYMQAESTFKRNNWHPDYSDIRAYQLFQAYDAANTQFWNTAITITVACFKAVFNFGPNDKRITEDANTGPIHPAASWVKLSNPTYQNLEASSDFSKVTATRGGSDPQLYTSDSQRLPIRLVNYIDAMINSSDADMFGVANANLTALGTSYTNTNYMYLVDKEEIKSPWTQYAHGWIQNFTAAGLYVYASNGSLTYGNKYNVYNSLYGKFGSNGIDGTIALDLTSEDGFNSSLTLWGLTVSTPGETLLQKYTLSLP